MNKFTGSNNADVGMKTWMNRHERCLNECNVIFFLFSRPAELQAVQISPLQRVEVECVN